MDDPAANICTSKVDIKRLQSDTSPEKPQTALASDLTKDGGGSIRMDAPKNVGKDETTMTIDLTSNNEQDNLMNPMDKADKGKSSNASQARCTTLHKRWVKCQQTTT